MGGDRRNNSRTGRVGCSVCLPLFRPAFHPQREYFVTGFRTGEDETGST